MNTFNKDEISQFLKTVSAAEPSEWESVSTTLTPTQKLNQLMPQIFQQNDQDLIHLLRRAIRNHDALSKEKAEPFTYYYKNYLPPSYGIPTINLTLDVQPDKVLVTSHLTVERKSHEKDLILDGNNHIVSSVAVNGKKLLKTAYKVTPNELIILDAPQDKQFTVTVESAIDPYHNKSLEGLYLSGDVLTTQCESEGARKIFYTLDRPDVLSRITTTIIADAKKYPYRLSNGNLISESTEKDGRKKIVWEDPTLKPCYLYACVLGNFGKINGTFTTKSERNVQLEVYVEPGKENRAQYALEALKLAMQYDEQFFDREYDLDFMKMVGVPDFNAGAMENKGLMIFNEMALLVDQHSGTDSNFRSIAHTVAHEYFHNWSGNRVTVRNWFELALKEAFTDFRTLLFGEWLFGAEFIRPKDVMTLREMQFPEELSKCGHPIMVDEYVDAHAIYDNTTYVKGREVFRTLQNYLDMKVPGGFRKAQNIYFDTYDGQAVTFKELLTSAGEVLQDPKSLAHFEKWFSQQGTPQLDVELTPKALIVTQRCPHPKTGAAQDPFLIPFSYELLRQDGSVAAPKVNVILSEASHTFELPTQEKVIPVLLHGYSAPVILNYNYSREDLACLMTYATDPFCRWEAGQNYSLMALRAAEQGITREVLEPYIVALKNPNIPLIAKAQLLQIPSIRALSQKYQDYDFAKLQNVRQKFIQELGKACAPTLKDLLAKYPDPKNFAPTPEQMQIRELRSSALRFLAEVDQNGVQTAYQEFKKATNFNTSFATFRIFTNLKNGSQREEVIQTFYQRWNQDKTVFNHWLAALASSDTCTPSDLKKMMRVQGFDPINPNHLRAVIRTFTSNLGAYHDARGEGYAFVVDQILSVTKFNPSLAYKLAASAFIDHDHLPLPQKQLMDREMKRLLDPSVSAETRALVKQMTSL